jgi:hypothetical protein
VSKDQGIRSIQSGKESLDVEFLAGEEADREIGGCGKPGGYGTV